MLLARLPLLQLLKLLLPHPPLLREALPLRLARRPRLLLALLSAQPQPLLLLLDLSLVGLLLHSARRLLLLAPRLRVLLHPPQPLHALVVLGLRAEAAHALARHALRATARAVPAGARATCTRSAPDVAFGGGGEA